METLAEKQLKKNPHLLEKLEQQTEERLSLLKLVKEILSTATD